MFRNTILREERMAKILEYYVPMFIVLFSMLIVYAMLRAVIHLDMWKDDQEGMCARSKQDKRDGPVSERETEYELEGFVEARDDTSEPENGDAPKPANEDKDGSSTTDCKSFCDAWKSDLETMDDYKGLKYRVTDVIPSKISDLEKRLKVVEATSNIK